ncbi:MAG TPA: hypothetical protein VLG72_09260 [Nitrospirota bacterium]|nr:hypothetical protein [Nitrospirota bacterium]
MQFLGNHDRILVLNLAEWQYSPALNLCDDGNPPAPVIHGGIQNLIRRDDEPPSMASVSYGFPSDPWASEALR